MSSVMQSPPVASPPVTMQSSVSALPTSSSASDRGSFIPNVGEDFKSQSDFIKYNRKAVIQNMAADFKKNKGNSKNLVRVIQLEQLLKYLNNCIHMTPKLRKATAIDVGIDRIIDPVFCFPEKFVDMATQLKKKWVDQDWGADAVVDDASDAEMATSPTLATLPAASSSASSSSTIVPPPCDHPIFGERGIMHGVVIVHGKNANRVYRRNLNYSPRNAMVFGDNGLVVGQWWPMQIVALFNGAHGSSQGGIAGNAHMGAYSIVIAGKYSDLDDDRGDVIYYSGSRSHRNTDANQTSERSGFTQALYKSIRLHRPVRVLRSASGKSTWAPSVGIRYDGLYRITKSMTGHNTMGGLFERFKLERIPGQPDLLETIRSSPTAEQKRDFTRIQERY